VCRHLAPDGAHLVVDVKLQNRVLYKNRIHAASRQLGEYFNAPVAEEFVRAYAAERLSKIELKDHEPIVRGQIESENAAIGSAGDLVILDTDLVSTVIYCKHYFGACPDWIYQQARARAADLYLLLVPDIPWIADGIRDRGNRREEIHSVFRRQLEELELNVLEIRGDRDRRFQIATAEIERVLRGSDSIRDERPA
jgi:NadR type nicotinamide-nucleotide adenylyltransferase